MLKSIHPAPGTSVSRRLSGLAQLTDPDRALLQDATLHPQLVPTARDLIVEGQRTAGPLLVLEGWLGRTRLFRDGRRQILSFLVPGDVITETACAHPVALSTITALSDARLCPAPPPNSPGLEQAYAASAALTECYLFRQIARLGRMSAYERILDWLNEMHERLALAGVAGPDSFVMPLTQEILGDALGLTSVHVNRTLQAMRRDGILEWRGGVVRMVQAARASDPSATRGTAARIAEPAAQRARPPHRASLENSAA
ncbi:Crp/Fnr family transcriptional regulator [Sphingomonas pokkalii]|uniref:Crp/Fnr family transcriptional regulator n=1 Tax=Sphingomonas pokkalii TaxID=2175090 RepID=A0A2U0SFE8_9SPHN|nr:Crp/Fnr family transcriptional regulator [Sphingomonas pokkalii]